MWELEAGQQHSENAKVDDLSHLTIRSTETGSYQFCWLSIVRLSSEAPSWYQQKAVCEQITIKSLDTVTRHIQLFQAAAIYCVHVPKYQQTCWYSRINKHVDILSCLCKFVTIANYCICHAVQILHAFALDWTFVEQKSKPTGANTHNNVGNI